jgi:hypothetical protein
MCEGNVNRELQIEHTHGCTACGEVMKGFFETNTHRKICKECGGKVLDLQEAFDKILELQSLLNNEADEILELQSLLNNEADEKEHYYEYYCGDTC